MNLPSQQTIQALHRKYAPTKAVLDLVFTHCQIVCDIAEQILAGRPELNIDRELVRVGCPLHDITSQNLPLPHQDYLAETLEEALIMYADKFHSKTDPPCFNSYESYKQSVAKFGPSKVAKFEQLAQTFGVPDLAPLIKKYGHALHD